MSTTSLRRYLHLKSNVHMVYFFMDTDEEERSYMPTTNTVRQCLEPTIHTLYKEWDVLMFIAHCFITRIPKIEFWTRLYGDTHVGRLEYDVRYIIMLSLRTTLLITMLALL